MKTRIKTELYLIGGALVVAGLLVFSHLILAKQYAGLYWVEWTAALIPFGIIAIWVMSIRVARRQIAEEDAINKS